MKHLTIGGLTAVGIALMAAQPANAAFVSICDSQSPPCASGVSSPEPNVTFSLNNFEFGFQINSLTVQMGNTPATVAISEVGAPPINIIDHAAENDFSAVWILAAGQDITPENRTIFFTGPNDTPPQSGETTDETGVTGVSDVLHFTYSEDSLHHGHLDGTVISDVTGGISIAALNAAGIFATEPFVNENAGPFDFSNLNITANFQSISVPEIDAASGGAAIALLLGVLALVSERRRWRASELAG
jgi:hypothetical protein